MEKSMCNILFLLLVLHLNFVINEEEIDEKFSIDLSQRGRTFISILQHLKYALDNCSLAPGKNVQLNFDPPEGSSLELSENIFGKVKQLVPEYISTPDTTYTLVVKENIDHFLEDLSLGISCGFIDHPDTNITYVRNISETFQLKIPSYNSDINSTFMMMLQDFFSKNHGVVCEEKPVSFIVQISPPQGSKITDENMLADILKTQLENVSPCELRYTINRKLLQSFDETIRHIEYLINLFRYIPKDVEDFVIDLTKRGIDYSKILGRLFSRVIMSKSQKFFSRMNILVKLPKGVHHNFIEDIIQMTQDLLQIVMPDLRVKVNLPSKNDNVLHFHISREENTPDGQLILDLTIPRANISSYIETILGEISAGLKIELNMRHSAMIKFIMKTPPHQGQSYVAHAENELLNVLKNHFEDCEIDMQSQADTDSHGMLIYVRFEVSLKPIPKPVSSNFKPDAPPSMNYWNSIIQTTTLPKLFEEHTYIPPFDVSMNWGITTSPELPEMKVQMSSTSVEMDKWEATTSPGSTSLEIKMIPPIYLFWKIGDVIETVVIPELSERMLDIISMLKGGNPCDVSYLIQFPEGINQQNFGALKQMIVYITKTHFPNYLTHSVIDIKEKYGNSVKFVEIKIIIQPVEYEEIFITSTNPNIDTLNLLGQELSYILENSKRNLSHDEKAGIILNIKNTQRSPDILDIIRTVDVILQHMIPNYNYHLNIDANCEKFTEITIILEKSISQKQSGNAYIDLSLTIDAPEKSPRNRIDEALRSIYPSMKSLLDDGHKVMLSLNMELPTQSNRLLLQNTIRHLTSVLRHRIPNLLIGFTPYARRNSNQKFSSIHLEITLELYRYSETTHIENFTINLSDPQCLISSEIKKKLANIFSAFHSNRQKSITFNLNINPPKKSTKLFIKEVIDILVPLLVSHFCNYESTWKTTSNTNLEGFLEDIVISLTFKQSGNSRHGTIQCQDDVDIDMTKPGSQLDVEIDKILQNRYNRIEDILTQGETQTLNFKVLVPPGMNSDYLTYLSESFVGISQNYFPNNHISSSMHATQTAEGYLLTAYSTITIQPEMNPLPDSLINIRLDTSLGGSFSFYVKNSIPQYMTSIQKLLAQHKSVVISFNVSPPKGVKEDYFQMISTELMSILREPFKTETIRVQGEAAKNFRGELFKVMLAVTIS